MSRVPLSDWRREAAAFAARHRAHAPQLGARSEDGSLELVLDGLGQLVDVVRAQVPRLRMPAFVALGQSLCPALLRPVPRIGVFSLLGSLEPVVRPGTEIVTRSPGGRPVRFRTLDEIAPNSVQITRIHLQPRGLTTGLVLRLALRDGRRWPASLLLHVVGADRTAQALVGALRGARAEVRLGDRTATLPDVAPVGLDAGLCTVGSEPPAALQHFQTYACARERFAFVRITGLADAIDTSAREVEVVLSTTRPLAGIPIDPGRFRLDAVAAVNAYETTTEPLRVHVGSRPTALRVAGASLEEAAVVGVVEARARVADGSAVREVPVAPRSRFELAYVDPVTPLRFAVEPVQRGAAVDLRAQVTGTLPMPWQRPTVVSFSVVATDRTALQHGQESESRELHARLLSSSALVEGPAGAALATRALAFAQPSGRPPRAALQDALALHGVPAWGEPAAFAGCQARIEAIHSVEVRAAHDDHEGCARIGYKTEVEVEETAFDGVGDLLLFGEVVSMGLAAAMPVGTFQRLVLRGRATGFEETWTRTRAHA